MDNFKQVTTDIINAIYNINYEDKEKKLIQVGIMRNLVELFKSQESYNEDIMVLRDYNSSSKKLSLNYSFPEEQ